MISQVKDHADSGRLTPYEMVFGEDRFSEQVFPAIAEEARRQLLDPWRRDQFARLESVGSLLLEVLPEGDEAAAVDQYLQILYHAYHFWNAGCPLYAVEKAVLRRLVESAPKLEGWRLRLPEPALYVELPRNLFWAEVTGGPPEPVEGLHLAREPKGAAEVDVLLVLGMRPERGGFSVAGLSLDPERALALEAPESFASDIPGAELAGLYSLRRFSEAAVLTMRLLWYVDTNPAALQRVSVVELERRAPGHSQPTALGHVRVSLVERRRG